MADDKNVKAEPLDMEAAAEKVLKDVEAKAAEIIKAAEAKAEEIMAGAKESVAQTVSKAAAADAGPSEEELARAHEKVEVELFKDNNLYKDDVYVAVNGENIKIKRGVPVKIDRMFKEVLDNSRRQDSASADLNEKLQDEFANKSKDLQ